ncbi:MAG: M6 family metalloprotease domain-containing protein [Paludibacter sp.]|nr:M6 family metalloprotease domain-containing protein [Paludibacter sp.]
MIKGGLILLICAFFIQCAIVPVFAVKADPNPVTITQSDGTKLTIQLHGDEFHHFQTTEDNYLIKRNAKGVFNYATLDAGGNMVVSNYKAQNINKRSAADLRFLNTIKKESVLQRVQKSPLKTKLFQSNRLPQKAFPLNGSPKSLIILINFTDTTYVTSTPQVAFTNLLNQDGYSTNGGTGSARDYFMASSYGKFAPTFDVVGPFTLPHKMAFYGANDVNGNDVNPQQMVVDACTAADSSVDFAQYDTDNDGIIDNVFIYYAGYNEAEHGSANSIWPHRWSVTSVNFDNKVLLDYACTSELRGNTGSNMCGIGTFCHEFGHVLGLPDYYDTSLTQTNALNDWSIMDAGAYSNSGRTPPLYSVYDRFYLGYLTPEQINSTSDLTLLPISQSKIQPANTTNQTFLFSETNHNMNVSNPSPNEFFMVEYRKKTGWDTYLPAEGMCIWHIDYDKTDWSNNVPNNYSGLTQTFKSHMRVYLVPPTGVGTTPPSTAFSTGRFSPVTWTGTNINRTLSEITKSANDITFKLTVLFPQPQVKVGVIENLLLFPSTKLNEINSKLVNIKTSDLVGDLTVLVSGMYAQFFTVSVSGIPKNIANNTNGISIGVNYKPTTLGSHSAVLTISGGGLNPAKVIILNGEGK